MRMRGKVAIVTGAASGLGRATALRFAEEGARVACADRAFEGAQATAKAIEGAGGEALAVEVNVTDEAACARMVTATVGRWQAVTTLVNAAGVRGGDRRDPAPATADWQRIIDVNLTGTFFASRAALPALRAARGVITNIASIYGLVGGSISPAYAASKGGVANLTRQMALDWAPDVRVNCVCPGVVETPMTKSLLEDPAFREAAERRHPLKRLGRPEDVANAILYLCSDEASWVTGVALPVDGGYTAA
ncbi:MAG: SDR family oxidoreductase [Candidatus Rokubacteria bacterium]|nr:SDR family oxidoreductase [Candidatus Rokubacteria bacterium]MBI3827662.1 SDR family oxidoreductase [Candidatus Rokubacteria bacterium]